MKKDIIKPFSGFARHVSYLAGHPATCILAFVIIGVWLITGPFFGYSDTWQLIINTATTIITFLMVFLIQNTQNRDGEALQIKLDELIRANKGAHNVLLDIEELTQEQLDLIKERYEKLAREARIGLDLGKMDTESPEV